MGIKCFDAITMIDDDGLAIPCAAISCLDNTIGSGEYRCARKYAKILAVVRTDLAGPWVRTRSEW